jgi:hypothetical protein
LPAAARLKIRSVKMVQKLVAAAVFSALVGYSGFAAAQAAAPAPQSQRGARMIERMCGAPVRNQSGKYAERLAERLTLTDAQKALLKNWQDARQKSREDSRTALCAPKPDFSTFAGRMNFREKRLETQLASFKATRPSMESFYNSLDDKQKASWDAARERRDGGRRHGRRDRD